MFSCEAAWENQQIWLKWNITLDKIVPRLQKRPHLYFSIYLCAFHQHFEHVQQCADEPYEGARDSTGRYFAGVKQNFDIFKFECQFAAAD